MTTAPIGPLVKGKGITYQLVQQDEGYFEGKMVITNRTSKPMKTWKLTFQAPRADVKNIWGARLVHGGSTVEIRNLEGAPAIPPGGTWDVQFGAAGPASTPKSCKLNGKACGF
ncbi:cellulose binding domain-containing protein [Actinomadura madurae]|uniref:cellulose binding domain-containing protein n=1 Tax=Actinomadura madurae TaxID=1993 RepID=UPI0020D23915|nr:cellulose binding domain-containing protein [Actinomadura madurae]MCP9983551.1 cellulose-binding domain-containing protein [Actinomadura madurae]MCQ0004881.1 cellulose-binding domain-containing protein [Actinomadura madurae]